MVPGNLTVLLGSCWASSSRHSSLSWGRKVFMMRCLSRTLGLQLPFPVIIIDTKPSLFLTANNPQLLISTQFSGYSFQLLYKDPLLLAYATSLHCCSTASQMRKPFGEALFCLHNPLPRLLCVVVNGTAFSILRQLPWWKNTVWAAKRRSHSIKLQCVLPR